jgi:hypothetical protein
MHRVHVSLDTFAVVGPHKARESGQAAVESALVLPLMVFMVLGILQLTLIQQAKLLTEYAAYQAARAGSVWNGNMERMHDAALIAILPTIHKTDNIGNVGLAWGKAWLYDNALQQLPWGSPMVSQLNNVNMRGLVRIDTVSPTLFPQLNNIWKLRGGANWQELDFDGPDTYPEVPGIEPRLAKFFNQSLTDNAERTFRRATVLSIRVRYWYEMRIPFANSVIFIAWFASNADVALFGSIDRSTTMRQNMLGTSNNLSALAAQGRGIAHQKGYESVVANEMRVLWGLASGSIPLVGAALGKKYFLPLTATYSMRMQSNFHRKWALQPRQAYAP